MSTDICKAIFRKLAADGTVFTQHLPHAARHLLPAPRWTCWKAYYNDARMNGLSVDRHGEEKSIELFAENIVKAGKTFLDNPNETPFIPNWNRVNAADPTILTDLKAAAAADEAEFDPAG
jgi:glucosyl-3-phosphoglycerate synthase